MNKREYSQANRAWIEAKAQEEGVKALPKGIYYKVCRRIEMKVSLLCPRTPYIAKMFRLAGLSENVGFGMKKILRWKELTGKDIEIVSAIDYSLVTFTLENTTNTTENYPKKLPEKTTRKNYLKKL